MYVLLLHRNVLLSFKEKWSSRLRKDWFWLNLTIFLLLIWSFNLFIADFIHPCNDTSSECLIKATQDAVPDFVKGLPHLGVPVLDPFVIDKLSIPLSGLTFTFYQGKVSGFRHAVVDNVMWVNYSLLIILYIQSINSCA